MSKNRNEEQKRTECWFLTEARRAGVPIPSGEIPSEEPDFSFRTGSALGVELSEVLRPASSNHGILPVAEESAHQKIIEDARQAYYQSPSATPVHVHVFFSSTRGKKHNKSQLAQALKDFVLSHVQLAVPMANFYRPSAFELLQRQQDKPSLPEGFDSIHLYTDIHPHRWSASEVGGITISDIRPLVEARIAAKEKLVKTYRANLPRGADVWLLLYTSVTVARGMPIPLGADGWRIPSQFDRVFWFTSLDRQFVEIRGS